MLVSSHKISVVTHPAINALYLKEEWDRFDNSKDVLVIEASRNSEQSNNEILLEILEDLRALREQVEQKAGTIDEIDIRWN